MYTSIARAIARRPSIEVGGAGFTYHRPVRTVLWVFIALSALEIPIIDLIARNWPPVRIALLVLGVWGVTWMVGLLCAMLMRPHTVGPSGIRVRGGLEIDVPIPWGPIAFIAIDPRVDQPKTPRVTHDASDGSAEYAERVQYETNILIELEAPLAIRLPGSAPAHGGAPSVTSVRLWADDPRALLAAARPFLLAHA